MCFNSCHGAPNTYFYTYIRLSSSLQFLDLLDIVAINDGPQLQSFRKSSPEEFNNTKEPDQIESNKMPVELLRRASETATISILDLESENEHLLGEKLARQKDDGQKRPQPPPRVNVSSKGNGELN